MSRFTAKEIAEIDTLWRAVPSDHVWSGWAAAGEAPEEIWIFRTRAHWRKFPLTKTETGYAISDESRSQVATARSLPALLKKVEAIPGLRQPAQD